MKIRQIMTMAVTEYKNLLVNSRLIMLPILAVFLKMTVIDSLLQMQKNMGQFVTALEPFIAVTNSGLLLLVLPLSLLFFISDYPKNSGNILFMMFRTGKLNWFIGQMIAGLMTVVTYIIALLTFTIIDALIHGCSSPVSALTGRGWSNVILKYESSFPGNESQVYLNLIPKNLYQQMSEKQAVLYSAALLFMYFVIIMMIQMYFFLRHKKKWGIFINIILICAGTALTSLKLSYMWIFPVSHSILWLHFNEYLSEYAFRPSWSCIYFGAIFIITLAGCLICLKNMTVETPELPD
jgi:hypothetical protein